MSLTIMVSYTISLLETPVLFNCFSVKMYDGLHSYPLETQGLKKKKKKEQKRVEWKGFCSDQLCCGRTLRAGTELPFVVWPQGACSKWL